MKLLCVYFTNAACIILPMEGRRAIYCTVQLCTHTREYYTPGTMYTSVYTYVLEYRVVHTP
jgi:hypothetical protein